MVTVLKPLPIMSAMGLERALTALGLTQVDLALCLCITPRTVRRWIEGTQTVSGPADRCIRAWLILHRRNEPWKPFLEPELLTLKGPPS